ncbi:MAG TPA: alpha/beta hydrolase, partial [Longimicrobium sp.]
ITLLLLSSACAHRAGSLSAGGAATPAPHRTGRVAVAPGVRVEYVDWGGRGEPLVFLAGLGNTAHVFDEFAPRFASGHRVVGITRRGFGASDRPAGGYDTRTLAADVRAVLDSLGIGRATLVAHSLAGAEASALAAADPGRFPRVVYLDSYDFGCAEPPRPRQPEPGDPPLPPNRFVRDPLREPLAPADSVSAEAAHAAWVRRLGWSMPVDELRAERGEAPAGARSLEEPQVMRAMMMGKERCFQAAPPRALNVFAEVRNPRFEVFDEAMNPVRLDSAQVAALTRGLLALVDADHARFTRQLPGARVAMVPNAHHFVFLSNPDETYAAVRAFLAEVEPR